VQIQVVFSMTACERCGEPNLRRARFCPNCGAALAQASGGDRDVRKTVTVLFTDLVDSTPLGERLDPEPLRVVLGRYFEVTRELLERHGATVRKFAGDAVMAVFGVPTLHEDDALRAVTAASRLGGALAGLNEELDRTWNVRLDVRTGVNTGEVVVDDLAGSHADVLGDPVNLAARLQQAAGIGEILVGDATFQHVREAVTAAPVPPLAVKGKEDQVTAWRLLSVDNATPRHALRRDAPMIGRERELSLLRWAFERAVAERRCHLVTLVGDAGVGKSRLVDEFQRLVRTRARILRGHCPSYGETAAFRPIAQVVQQLAGIRPGEPVPASRAKLAPLLADPHLTDRVVQVLGLGAGAAEPEDSYWALRRMLELLAARQPLVLAVDDLHWAQPPLLDLLQHVGQWSHGAPILLICLTRPELMEGRRDWMGSTPNAISILLSPLPISQTEELVDNLLRPGVVDPELRTRLAEAAGGYPLFVEELIGLLTDDGTLGLTAGAWKAADGLNEIRLPPTIHALLAARLDRLPEPERRVLGRAAVIGAPFPAAAISALLPAHSQDVTTALLTLVRKELLRSEARPGGRDRFNFRHTLIRDASYQAVPKQVRAELHQQYASWVDRAAREQGDASDDLDEIVGYHLETAYRLRMQLGRLDEPARTTACLAGERLARAGRRAVRRGDVPTTAVSLLGRALALLPEDHPQRRDTLLHHADALWEDHRPRHALALYEEALDLAGRAGDPGAFAHAALGRLHARSFSDLRGWGPAWRLDVDRAIQVLGEAGDTAGLAKGWRLLATLHWATGRAVAAEEAVERAIGYARRAGDQRLEARILRLQCVILYWGPTPLEHVIRSTDQALGWARRTGTRTLELCALSVLARAAAMEGRFDEARRLNQEARAFTPDDGELLTWGTRWVSEEMVELLANNLEEAERVLREGVADADREGGAVPLASLSAMLARVLLLFPERDEEAAEAVTRCERLTAGTNLDARIRSRSMHAVLLARRGEHARAVRLARVAARRAEQSEQPDSQAEVLLDLAETLRISGRLEEAISASNQALDRFEHKGNLVGAERVRQFQLSVI
jgi:class 3 adenylate cyclase/tetratricopeptide (TPR) repeat protein